MCVCVCVCGHARLTCITNRDAFSSLSRRCCTAACSPRQARAAVLRAHVASARSRACLCHTRRCAASDQDTKWACSTCRQQVCQCHATKHRQVVGALAGGERHTRCTCIPLACSGELPLHPLRVAPPPWPWLPASASACAVCSYAWTSARLAPTAVTGVSHCATGSERC